MNQGERRERRIQALNTLKTIAEKLNEANDLEVMLKDVLKELLHVTNLQSGWIFLVGDENHYDLVADYSLPPALTIQKKKPMCEGDCWCLDKFKDGRLNKAANIINCKRIEDAIEQKWGDTNQITHHATVPLQAGDEKFGLLNIASPNKTHFTNEELALLESVALQIGTAIKRIKLVENEQKHALIAERNRLAQDLHDSVNQLLFSLMLTARGTKEMTEDENVKEMLTYMQTLSQEALSEMKALIWQLRPQGLENGIGTALLNYGNVLNLDLALDVKGVNALPCQIEETLWRIGQEALNNCKKHAGTSKVHIVLTRQNHVVSMVIEDKGIGFTYDEKAKIPSLGLQSMKERTTRIKGNFQLISSVGNGTKVEITIPI